MSSSPQPVRTPVLGREQRRRLGAFLVLAVVAALVTGSDGDYDTPGRAVRDSLFAPRIVPWLVAAVALWALVTLRGQLPGGSGLPGVSAVSSAAASWRALLEVRGVRPVGYLLLLALACLVPLGLAPAAQNAAFLDVGIYALLALGLNVVVGWAGLLDLGYIAFYAIGAYVTAYLTSNTALPVSPPFVLNPFFVFPLALLVAAFAGIVLGGPTLRLRGDYLAIVTLGFGEIVQIVANNSDSVTNGSRGAFGIPTFSVHVGPLDYSWSISKPLPYYYLLVAVIVLVMVAFSRLERSRIGRAWAAIREDEVAAEASGVPTLRLKLLAFAIGASTSGFAGVLLAGRVGFVNPQTFTIQASILVLTVVIFGGMGSLVGVVVGSVVLQGLAFALRDQVPPADRYLYFGAVILVMMVFRPQGLLPSRRRSQEIAQAEEGVGGADSLGASAARATAP